MAETRTTNESEITIAQARTLLERHFGTGKVPEKHMSLIDWWARLLADPAAPGNSLRACERDLDEIVGPIVGERVGWRMRT